MTLCEEYDDYNILHALSTDDTVRPKKPKEEIKHEDFVIAHDFAGSIVFEEMRQINRELTELAQREVGMVQQITEQESTRRNTFPGHRFLMSRPRDIEINMIRLSPGDMSESTNG